MVQSEIVTVVTKGSKIYVDNRFGYKRGERSCHRIVSYNGSRTAIYQVTDPPLVALGNGRRERETQTQGLLFTERGFLPLRWVLGDHRDADKIRVEFTVTKAVEIQPGLWFATRGRKKVYPMEGVALLSAGTEQDIYGEAWPGTLPGIAVNRGITDDFFDIWKWVPPGTHVFDEDSKKEWVVGINDKADGGK